MDQLAADTANLLKSLGFPTINAHHAFNHFDFSRPARRILVIGPMGSGKTEYSSRVWRDSIVALGKSSATAAITSTAGADRRRVFFIRSSLDRDRFPDYPQDALAYRGGYERCGENIAAIRDSYELEAVLDDHPDVGTWIVDEASFYDERIAYVIRRRSAERGLVFVFPTLILNFRKEIFNPTAKLLLEIATDVFPLTAYCEHPDCLRDSFYTYRYYTVDGRECPALFFDPLIIIGGGTKTADPREPNYCTRCDDHHYLPGKEYTYLYLKPMGVAASAGDLTPLRTELGALTGDLERSTLYRHIADQAWKSDAAAATSINALLVPCLAERALIYLFSEENLVSAEQVRTLIDDIGLDREYVKRRIADNGRTIDV